ncbi:MAG: 1-deoxy-D-xylulose-5-phosphate reductoisomerase [Rhodothermaceae bacterium]|nr:1-deoxy-D-xylulose-5-phosphate reductoisomerase [Rhodothermaceae bacterium]
MLPASFHPASVPAARERGLAILGSTGSIGTQTLEIATLFPERLQVRALAAGSNGALLAEQARQYRPDVVCLADETGYAALKESLAGTGVRVLAGVDALAEIAMLDTVDVVVAAIVGAAGLRPTLVAVEAGKTVALANKETLVMAGALVQRLAREHGATLLPVDSEHSAIFQCLVGEDPTAIEMLTLTASGGPFRARPADTFSTITRAEALAHPNWSMGAKITIDSATLMNKGLEVIEAHWLFGLPPEQIEVLVHPQSIIHSLVTFRDGSTKAQLGVPDMKVPIQYALTYPDRWSAPHDRIDWSALRCLDFEAPDLERFPSLGLAFEALRQGGTAPAVLNAANEAAVALFLNEQIGFADIPELIEDALGQRTAEDGDSLEALIAVDQEARRLVHNRVAVRA